MILGGALLVFGIGGAVDMLFINQLQTEKKFKIQIKRLNDDTTSKLLRLYLVH